MTKARSIVIVLALVLFVLPFSSVLAQGTIVDVAAGSDDFSTLAGLIDAGGVADALSADGPLTVFAPTNAAFDALPDFVVPYLEAHPDILTQVLQYHVVEGDVMGDMVASMDMGNELTIVSDDTGISAVNDANVVSSAEASNGMVYGIDQVLLPPMELPEVVPAFVEGAVIAAGSSTVFPLSEEVVNRWVEEGGPQSITLDSIGSGAGYERFCVAGESDIANASRAIRETEVESCHAIDRDVFPIRVGTDALAVVVNAENTFATEMTLEELALVFSIAATWQDVNPEWPAEPIERFIPGTDSGTFDYFVEEVFDEDEAPILAAENTSLSEDDNVLVTGVTGNPYAIAFFGYSYFAANEGALNAVAIESVAPNATNVNAGTYPLARPLFMYSAPEVIAEKAQVGEFLSYYLSVVNEEVVDANYFPAPSYALNRASFYVAAAIDAAMM